MKTNQTEPLLELDGQALSLVAGGAPKDTQYILYRQRKNYSGSTPKNYLKKKK